jgi:hypothetical protein
MESRIRANTYSCVNLNPSCGLRDATKIAKPSCLYFHFPVLLNAMTQTELKRQIGLFDAVTLIAGDMIGSGILVTARFTAEFLPLPNGGA